MLAISLDALNAAYHKAGERNLVVRTLENVVKKIVGRGLTLVFVPEIGEYGVFSSREPYLQEAS